MSTEYAIINGEFVPKNEATIRMNDLSIQRGYGIFDYFRTIQYQPVFLDEHLARLYYSAEKMRLTFEHNSDQLKELIYQLIQKNDLPDSGIRITITGGYSGDGYSIGKPNVVIEQNPFGFNKESFEKGIRLMSYGHQRQLSDVKTIDYLQAIYLQPLLKEKQADDILYHHQGIITECPRANFFMVTHDEEVITPSENILKGITRKKILSLKEFTVLESEIHLNELKDIKEAFITSTTKNVLPVLQIDGLTIGDGKPGPVTTAIYQKICALRGEAG
ncbi:MAG TPA: aminotransferase class IV [Daejeonella sp.]|nr:aminotransferase class IV [Daejeonella sp.]